MHHFLDNCRIEEELEEKKKRLLLVSFCFVVCCISVSFHLRMAFEGFATIWTWNLTGVYSACWYFLRWWRSQRMWFVRFFVAHYLHLNNLESGWAFLSMCDYNETTTKSFQNLEQFFAWNTLIPQITNPTQPMNLWNSFWRFNKARDTNWKNENENFVIMAHRFLLLLMVEFWKTLEFRSHV